jgi:hypothetical protein
MTDIKNGEDLLAFVISQSKSGQKAWFGFTQQKIIGIYMCYEIARLHADRMTPDEVAEYVFQLNNAVFEKIIKKG